MKRAILGLAFAALTACNPSPTPSAPPAADQASTKSPPSCVDQCNTRYAGADDTLTPLDDCVIEQCQPLDDAPPASDATCPAVGAGPQQVSYGYAPTDACIARACCAQAASCAGDAKCAQLSACIRSCNGE